MNAPLPATGVVVPALLVDRMGYRQVLPAVVLTQLPPGALIVTCGPRLENPTLVPTCRRPATAMTLLQLAGVPTAMPPSLVGSSFSTPLPAATTTVAPAL